MHGGATIAWSRWRIVAVAALAAGLLFGACSDGATKPTGIRDVDRAVEAVESQDLDALLGLVKYLQEPCSTNPQTDPLTLYTPPACPEGTSDGMPVDVIITGNCEVGPTLPEAVEETLRGTMVEPAREVFAVVGPSTVFRWDFDYMLILAEVGEPDAPRTTIAGMRKSGIALAAGYCGPVSEAVATSTSDGGRVVYVAPGVTLETPEPAP